MNRITRLLGVRPAPRPHYGVANAAWVTPALLSVVFVAGVSAVGIASPDVIEDAAAARGHHQHPDVEPLPIDDSHAMHQVHAVVDIDLVEVVRQLDAVQGEMLALLREAGFDNREMAEMLHYLGTDKRVLSDVERAIAMERKLEAMDARLAAAHQKMQAAVEAGTMSETEARARFHYYQEEMEGHRAKLLEDRARETAVHRRMIEMEAAGMTREEIDRALRPERIERRKRQADQARAAADAKLAGMRRHLDEALAAGKVTPEKAAAYMREVEERVAREVGSMAARHAEERRIEAAVDEMRARGMTDEAIHEALRERGLLPRERKARPSGQDVDAAKAKLDALKALLTKEVAAGRLTEQEAQLKLEVVQDKLHSDHGRQLIQKELREQGFKDSLVGRVRMPDYAERVERRIAKLTRQMDDAGAAGRPVDADMRRQLEELEMIRERLRQER